jgi:penicillin-binding protein activator
MMMAPSIRQCRAIVLCAATVLALGATACKPKAVRGGEGTENPNLDAGAMSTGLDRVDLQDLMRTNMNALKASPLWARWRSDGQQPIVAIWPIKNDTSEHLDAQMLTLLSDMETDLINSGIVSVVSRERQEEMMAEVGLQQGAEFNPSMASQFGRQLGAKYFITGKLQSVDERLNKERRVQYSLFMQVIETETSLVKFQHKSERSKAIVR